MNEVKDRQDYKWYYQDQLDKLQDFTLINIKLSDYSGSSTNYISLNKESIEVLLNFLTKLNKEL